MNETELRRRVANLETDNRRLRARLALQKHRNDDLRRQLSASPVLPLYTMETVRGVAR